MCYICVFYEAGMKILKGIKLSKANKLPDYDLMMSICPE